MGEREVRVQPVLDRFVSGVWLMAAREIVLVESKAWILVRRADYPQAMPFVMSRKEWDKLPLRSPSKDIAQDNVPGSDMGKGE